MYTIDSSTTYSKGVIVVGCGGTGGFVSEGLARMIPMDYSITLIDMDTVEESNLTRSSFTKDDIGRYKSQALAIRLSHQYTRPIQYSIIPVGLAALPPAKIIVGCVDNGPARKAISKWVKNGMWWIDSGNDHNFGQIFIGNAAIDHMTPAFLEDTQKCGRLPLPVIQQPALLSTVVRKRSCSEAVDANEQGPTINQAMAVLVLETVRRIIDGTCPWMQLYLDLDKGIMTPVMITPEEVSRITGIQLRKLINKSKSAE